MAATVAGLATGTTADGLGAAIAAGVAAAGLALVPDLASDSKSSWAGGIVDLPSAHFECIDRSIFSAPECLPNSPSSFEKKDSAVIPLGRD